MHYILLLLTKDTIYTYLIKLSYITISPCLNVMN